MIKNLAIGGGSNRMLLIAALVFGLLAAILVGVYLSNLSSDNGSSSSGGGATVPVVVAAQPIPSLTVVTEQMLTVKNIPIDVAIVGAFAKTSDVVGQTAQVNLAPGEQLLPTKVTSVTTALGQYGATTPLSLVVPPGMRAIAIQIGSIASAGGMIRPGDHVDLIHNTAQSNNDAGAGAQIAGACYVLQDVQVLTIGANIAAPDASTNANTLAAQPADAAAKLMVVAVSPEDAGQLAAAQSKPGDASVETPLWAVLRPFGERGVVEGVSTCGATSSQS
jgi:pilus assembly protein CpaB